MAPTLLPASASELERIGLRLSRVLCANELNSSGRKRNFSVSCQTDMYKKHPLQKSLSNLEKQIKLATTKMYTFDQFVYQNLKHWIYLEENCICNSSPPPPTLTSTQLKYQAQSGLFTYRPPLLMLNPPPHHTHTQPVFHEG